MLEKMKVALRITTDFFDDEIQSVIDAARAEMVRAGVSPEKANDDTDPLVTAAVRCYVLGAYSSYEKLTAGYRESFMYQLDCMRKSAEYRDEAKQ